MKKQLWKSLLVVIGLSLSAIILGAAAPSDTAPTPAGKTTFYKDVLPILQKNCQSCHRAGEVAPMSLMTYEEARPWAISIKSAILTKKMPPWYADPQYGHFSNERKLSPEAIKTLVTWVNGGAQAGDPKDSPQPVKFVDGWNIGVPDRVIEMSTAYNVPAEGTVDYQYMVIPGGFKEDTWVRAAEIRPGNRSLVHHVIAFIRSPETQWMRDAKPGEFFVPQKQGNQQENPEANQQRSAQPRRRGDIGELLVGYAPGIQPLELTDQARLVKAGSDIVLQLHYTANGTAGLDKSRIGLIFAKQPPKLRNLTLGASNTGFKIPANDGNYEVRSQVRFEETVTLDNLMPHMHFRGKDFIYNIIYPDGKTETLLSVPKYDFNWQLGYQLEKPLVLPKGTRIECIAHFDNSANNPYNPDPSKEVKWGDQTWEEMMIGWFSIAVDPKTSTAGLIKFEKPGTRTPPDVKSGSATPVAGAAASSTR
ncbi:MAG TPA: cytochrome c [Candidatus Saccharimonadales bacterium]|jgi:hypothetical protein|nr:cytochrome c [Candidatus Saccharimonadales bacterium]